MKFYLLLLAMAVASQLYAQNWPLKQSVTDMKKAGKPFTRVTVFTAGGRNLKMQGGKYQQLQLSNSFSKQVVTERPETMQIRIPLNSGETIDCELVKVNPGIVKFTENNKSIVSAVKIPVLYQGVVKGKTEKNNVVFTVNDEYVSLTAMWGNTSVQITKADEPNPYTYRLYNSADIEFPANPFSCGTKDNSPRQTAADISGNSGKLNRQTGVQDKCVLVYVDCFDSLYQWRGSSKQSTINYVYELFNLVIAGYLNDSIKIQLDGINVWTTMDPYRQPNMETAFKDLAFYHKDNFYGNFCLGLDYSTVVSRNGIASRGRVKAVFPNSCATYKTSDSSGAFAYCDLNYGGTYKNFPTGPNVTQAHVYSVMHEMGHILGSHHTHWCGWLLSQNPDVYGAIDNCAPVEPVSGSGPCAPGPTPPDSSGTIMSYCNIKPFTVNYKNGFGILPGNTIRTFVANSVCIPLCQNCPGSTGSIKNKMPALQEYTAWEMISRHKKSSPVIAVASGNQKGNLIK